MLRGDKVGLRAREAADVPVLHDELHGDVLTYARGTSRAWTPMTAGSAADPCGLAPEDDLSRARFSVVDVRSGELLGQCGLFGIDPLSRNAELGISLRPGARGRGFGADVVAVLCWYGFDVRGLHRIEIETLADNAAMRATARAAGFTEEGLRRQAAWVDGTFLDAVRYGLLAPEWRASRPRPSTATTA
ncbi:GNAT family N-acetyltransferase [Actinoplanes sp. RD1]|uniref:GNAT family N-acetyltransferase n=1 Tax=Actinoplanes sp. RD1 TaxID=3064538 RepID=UPI0027423D57|nr:GNAT family protein [Actinoplanes sp. RD1]